MTLTERQLNNFFAKVGSTQDCWLWATGLSDDGYGQIRLHGRTCYAHRVSYELFVEVIPTVLQLDHLCRVRHCVCPTHLEVVTTAENTRRARAQITHCRHGHEYTAQNTGRSVAPDGTVKRWCRKCKNAGTLARYHAARQKSSKQ